MQRPWFQRTWWLLVVLAAAWAGCRDDAPQPDEEAASATTPPASAPAPADAPSGEARFFRKQPLPLKKPLDRLDPKKLAPYALVRAFILQAEMIEQLGTGDYIGWLMADPYAPDGSLSEEQDAGRLPSGKQRQINLFVTYYTGQRDQVPHIPEIAYTGAGYE